MELLEGHCRMGGFQVVYAGATDPGRVRRCNEDNLLIYPEAGVFAVADGLGGLDAGDVASSTALAHLRELVPTPFAGNRFFALFNDKHPLRQLEAVVAAVNRRTYEHRMTLGKNMATTLAMVQLRGDKVVLAHVGDSRVYRWRDNALHCLTSDHSLVNELVRKGALTASQARQSSQRHVITRAVGAEPTVMPTLQQQPLAVGDILLLCTDGLTSMLSDRDIGQCLGNAATTIGGSVAQLITLANQAGGHDNITVVGVILLPIEEKSD
ncbi:protein serine/threonine phosphatase [Desulfobulbus propionicus DSM 2032]|jgi:protein phosphatase|uniref:Protein serine/threonine phosphatase n=1 Tax=Desulfobulbus propionicus (strain ATCC 33891 / DSM 2032 / VKM B-1956 / 1pr3) TaxID=577650 RepID=A0A7U4DN24_DESPD|nr:protein phosphatase 2C domain-containing protein [Desulfobulbus propionicus]ADW16612.1 protein serine/threonine phosphatase [Desulfobulbus propionicus DSM 2032]